MINLTAREAINEMWSIADKPERMRCFHKIACELDLSDLDAEKFWGEFWNIWTSSENLFADEDYFSDLIAIGQALGTPTLGLSEEEREALEALPEQVTIYRGACPHNQIGWSWTTDLEKARFFAKRAYGDKVRYVSKTTVNRDDILAFLTGRGESEVVVNPEDMDFDNVETIETIELDNLGPGLFYAIQTGLMLDNPEMEEAKARMMAQTFKPENFAKAKETFAKGLEFAEWAGLSRAGYFRKMVEMIERREKGERLFPEINEDGTVIV